jgi:hypothetical protein
MLPGGGDTAGGLRWAPGYSPGVVDANKHSLSTLCVVKSHIPREVALFAQNTVDLKE